MYCLNCPVDWTGTLITVGLVILFIIIAYLAQRRGCF